MPSLWNAIGWVGMVLVGLSMAQLTPDHKNLVMPPYQNQGECSPGKITSFSYNATTLQNTLLAVVATNASFYNQTLALNMSLANASEALLPFLQTMSCMPRASVMHSCNNALPPSVPLVPIDMCIIFFNGNSTINVTLDAQWGLSNGSAMPGPPNLTALGLTGQMQSSAPSHGSWAGGLALALSMASVLLL